MSDDLLKFAAMKDMQEARNLAIRAIELMVKCGAYGLTMNLPMGSITVRRSTIEEEQTPIQVTKR